MPSEDVRWVIGVVVAAALGLSVQISTQIGGLRADVRHLDDRLRAVEVALAKVDQRLSALERLHWTAPEPGPAD